MMVMLTDWPADLILLADAAAARFIWLGLQVACEHVFEIEEMHVSINKQYYDIFEQIV